MARIVILGAGLTGLSAAYHCEKLGFFDFEIFEMQEEAGGLLRSFTVDGFTFDYTGHLLHISDPYFTAFVQSITSFDAFLKVTRRAAIYSHNVITEYPFQMNLHGLPPDVIYECIEGYINRRSDLKTPQNFQQWVLKYFGAGMGKHFFTPYNSKILAYDTRKILPAWTGRFVPQTTLKEVLKGALEPQIRDNVGYNNHFFYPKKQGIQFLIKQIEKSLTTKPRLNHKVVEINLAHKTITFENGTTTRFEHIVSTLPLNKILPLIKGSSKQSYTHSADKLLCNSVINFNLGFKQPDLTDRHWLYYPEKKFPFYRIGFWHNINSASVPPGHSAIYGEASYLPHKTSIPARARLCESSIAHALKILNLHEQDIVVRKDLHLAHAYVIYDAWREKNIEGILKNLENDNIISTGRFGGWKYASMQEAVLDGKNASESLISAFYPNLVQGTLFEKPISF